MRKVAIIGAGASGILSALNLKKQLNDNVDIYLLEKNARIGKKIITSGNGKCNLTNETLLEDNIYNNKFASKIYNELKPTQLRKFLLECGLFTKTDSMNRVYPLTESSSTVMDILLMQLNNYNVHIYTDTLVTSISKEKNKYLVDTSNDSFLVDDVIISIGSNASIKNLTIAKHYEILTKLGLNLTNIKPGLVGLKVKKNEISGFSGIRQKSKVILSNGKKVLFEELGEVQFKDDGISGIVVMNASSIISRNNHNDIMLKLDLLPMYEKKDLVNNLQMIVSNNELILKDLLHGLLPKMISNKICTILEKKHMLTIENFIDMAKSYELTILDTYGFEYAQVCVGGLSIDNINDNLELKKYPNIYITGEVLDIDGLCGGYNLEFAFASGYVASMAICKKVGNYE